MLLATTDETKVEGEGTSKKKRRRKRKKAGMAYMKAVVQSSRSKETRDTLEEPKAARVLSDVVDVVMPDAGAADDYLVDIDMETFFEPPLPVSPPPTYAERAAKAAATLPPNHTNLNTNVKAKANRNRRPTNRRKTRRSARGSARLRLTRRVSQRASKRGRKVSKLERSRNCARRTSVWGR